jgi:hypothetical protein
MYIPCIAPDHCAGKAHKVCKLAPLNVPLFITTDIEHVIDMLTPSFFVVCVPLFTVVGIEGDMAAVKALIWECCNDG